MGGVARLGMAKRAAGGPPIMCAGALLGLLLAAGCSQRDHEPVVAEPLPEPAAQGDQAPEEAEAPQQVQVDVPEQLPGRTDGCPDGMVRVEGAYCPAVMQSCLEHHPEWIKRQGEPGVAERCLKYAEPSQCLAKRTDLSFCMDRFEYPNVPGELPHVLTSWTDARASCESQGKRLCTEREFNFACEGPEMLPYVYGYERDADTCNQDRDYRVPDHSKTMKHYEECLGDEWCAAELARLDQRERIGERKSCVSWSGVYDLNGNVNEWVVREGEKSPHRGGLKGGWWGPIRSRCRPMTTFHPEDDYGYESGFRCCSDPR